MSDRYGKYEVVERGQGQPLVMLHGMMGKPQNWLGVFPHLPANCRAIALRFPFFEDVADLSTVPAVSDYVADFLATAGLEKAVLCGNSLGGHVAIDLAFRMPDRVSGLVLAGSSGLFEKSFTTVTPHPPREWVYDKIRSIFYDAVHATDELVDETVRIISVRRNVRDLVRIAKSAKRDNVAERLGKVRCPVLLIWGKQDQITPPEVAEELHRGITGSELVWLDECGHTPMMEHPKLFGQTIARWWGKHFAAAPVAAPQAGGVMP